MAKRPEIAAVPKWIPVPLWILENRELAELATRIIDAYEDEITDKIDRAALQMITRELLRRTPRPSRKDAIQ